MTPWTKLSKEERLTILTNIAEEKGIVENIVKMMDKQFATDAINNAVMYNEIVAHRKSFTAWAGLD